MDSSTTATLVRNYDVFLSFQGEDTRHTFVSHLYAALCRKGIFTFKDDERLEVGHDIPTSLLNAIQTSWFAVVVISKNYAASKWCLEELRLVMELHRAKQIDVVPVFYQVEPSHVRHQTESFGVALQSMDDEAMVAAIVGIISSRMLPMKPTISLNLIGMEAHMMKMNLLLNLGSEDEEVRIVGIWGMGGVGKTTIANCLYSILSPRFPSQHFVNDIKKMRIEDLPDLRKQFLSDILLNQNIRFSRMKAGLQEMKARLNNKIFLVLDGVNKVEQIHALAKETSWFVPGSRIIITTQDWGLLCSCGVKIIHEIKCLNDDDALHAFKRLAFRGNPPPSDGFEQLFIRASRLAHGLPSALVSFASHLSKRTTIEEWEDELVLLEKAPHKDVEEILRYSYEDLDTRDKTAFLHVACFLNGYPFRHITSLLEDGRPRIDHLAAKSLISISTDGCIIMHALVVQIGREIVRQESKCRPSKQRILWDPNEIYDILNDNIGTEKTEGMTLHIREMPDTLTMSNFVFRAMHNLKFLKFSQHLGDTEAKLQLISDGLYFPRNLRLLHWDAYSLKNFHSRFQPHHLVELSLRYSNLESIWDESVNLQNLLRLDVTGCTYLRKLPDLSTAKKLEELIVEGCVRLERIPECIRCLKYLKKFNAIHCDSLRGINFTATLGIPGTSGCSWRTKLMFPNVLLDLYSHTDLSIDGQIQIKMLHLSGTAEHVSFGSKQQIPDEMITVAPQIMSYIKSFNIKQFSYLQNRPPFVCHSFLNLPCLTELRLINLNIQEIPDDIDCLLTLETMDLSGNDFMCLPRTMGQLTKLKYLSLGNCRKITSLPQLTQVETLILSNCVNLRSLVELHVDETMGTYCLLELWLENCNKVQTLSDTLRHFTKLTYLDLSRHDFVTVPSSIRELLSLGTLFLNNCKKLKSLEELPLSLKYLYAHGCDSLESVDLSPNHSIKHLDLIHCSRQELECPGI